MLRMCLSLWQLSNGCGGTDTADRYLARRERFGRRPFLGSHRYGSLSVVFLVCLMTSSCIISDGPILTKENSSNVPGLGGYYRWIPIEIDERPDIILIGEKEVADEGGSVYFDGDDPSDELRLKDLGGNKFVVQECSNNSCNLALLHRRQDGFEFYYLKDPNSLLERFGLLENSNLLSHLEVGSGSISFDKVATREYKDEILQLLQFISTSDLKLLGRYAYLPAAVAECDLLAASPKDPERKAKGVKIDELDFPPAIRACKEALRLRPASARLNYQYGRALHKARKYEDAYSTLR